MAFERFVNAQNNAPTATLISARILRVSASAVRRIGDPEYVTLHFDPDRRAIGILPAGRNDEGAYRLSSNVRGSRTMSVQALVAAYRVDPRLYKLRPVRLEGSMPVITPSDAASGNNGPES